MKKRGQNRNKILLLVIVLSLVLLLSGCGLVDKLVSIKEGLDEEPEISLGEEPNEQLDEWLPVEDPITSNEENFKLTLFFGDQLGQYLVKEERIIPKAEGIGRAAINELIKGPDLAGNLLPTIPDNTILLDINVKQDEKLAIVDFSRSLVDNHLGGSSAEVMTVYSIVNTLTQFPTVENVQILVNGQYVETIAGHLDVSKPLSRNELVIK